MAGRGDDTSRDLDLLLRDPARRKEKQKFQEFLQQQDEKLPEDCRFWLKCFEFWEACEDLKDSEKQKLVAIGTRFLGIGGSGLDTTNHVRLPTTVMFRQLREKVQKVSRGEETTFPLTSDLFADAVRSVRDRLRMEAYPAFLKSNPQSE